MKFILDYCYYSHLLNFRMLQLLNHFLLRIRLEVGMSYAINSNIWLEETLILLLDSVIITKWILNQQSLLHQINFMTHHDHKEISRILNRPDHLLHHFVLLHYLMTIHFQFHIRFIYNLYLYCFILHFLFLHGILLHHCWFHCFPNMFFWQFKLFFAFVKTLNYN